MSTTTTRRILCVVPLAAAVVLSVGACGATPWASGSNANTSTSSSTANAANSVASQPVAAPAPTGQSGLSGSTTGGSTAGGSGGSASAPSGQSGLASGSSGGSVSTAGLSPDDVGLYCKITGSLGTPEDQNTYTFKGSVPDLVELKKHTPVQLQPDVELLANDFKALGNETRVLPQVKDEVDASYKRVMDFHEQICVVH